MAVKRVGSPSLRSNEPRWSSLTPSLAMCCQEGHPNHLPKTFSLIIKMRKFKRNWKTIYFNNFFISNSNTYFQLFIPSLANQSSLYQQPSRRCSWPPKTPHALDPGSHLMCTASQIQTTTWTSTPTLPPWTFLETPTNSHPKTRAKCPITKVHLSPQKPTRSERRSWSPWCRRTVCSKFFLWECDDTVHEHKITIVLLL